ncbi:MAG: SGNH/GDSL hydrolase family protein, partial [Nanoarchaeota archaeon]
MKKQELKFMKTNNRILEKMNKKNIIILILVVLFSLILAELIIRLFTGIFEYNTMKTDAIGIQRVPNAQGKIIHPDFTTHYKYNSLGFRDNEHDLDSPVQKIVLLGDSFTEGLSVEYNQTFGYLLEQNIQYEVINFGLGGIGTSQSYFIMREYALKYNPDIIIYNFYPNDVRDNMER